MTVFLQYFTLLGEFVTATSYATQYRLKWKIQEEVEEKLHNRNLPGLRKKKENLYIVLMEVPGHPQNCKKLIVPQY